MIKDILIIQVLLDMSTMNIMIKHDMIMLKMSSWLNSWLKKWFEGNVFSDKIVLKQCKNKENSLSENSVTKWYVLFLSLTIWDKTQWWWHHEVNDHRN